MKEDIDKISLVKIPKYIYEDMWVRLLLVDDFRNRKFFFGLEFFPDLC